MSEKLKPCPKCGNVEVVVITQAMVDEYGEGRPKWFDTGRVMCSSSPCQWTEPIEWWNTRTANKEIAALQDKIAARDKLLRADDETIAEKDKEIAELRSKIETVNIQGYAALYKQLAVENEKLKAEVTELKTNTITVKSKGQLKKIYCQMGVEYVPKSEVAELKELMVMRLSAISLGATFNSKKTVYNRIGKDNPYWSVALQDVYEAIDDEMKLIEENARLKSALKENRMKVDEGKILEAVMACTDTDYEDFSTFVCEPKELAHAIAEELALNKGEVK